MLELVFGDNACASLQLAQHFGEGAYPGGCISVIRTGSGTAGPTPEEIASAQRQAEERERQAWETAVPMGGNPNDVLGFSLNLSVGDISEAVPGPKRLACLVEHYRHVAADMEEVCGKFLTQARDQLSRVLDASSRGESLRIWYSDAPDELCGFYWLMAQLEGLAVPHGPILAVHLPQAAPDGTDAAAPRRSWGDVPPGEWSCYVNQSHLIRPHQITTYSMLWSRIQMENSPIRVCLNGVLTSVSEKFYDNFLYREIAAQPQEFEEAWVIGRTLGRLPGVSDGLLAGRIQSMVDAGKLAVCTPPPADGAKYWRRLRKTSLFC